jgi:hypothetical protein
MGAVLLIFEYVDVAEHEEDGDQQAKLCRAFYFEPVVHGFIKVNRLPTCPKCGTKLRFEECLM